jgi:hypothetical protein
MKFFGAVLLSLSLAACARPAPPPAADRWPGFEPQAQGEVFLDQAALWLYLRSDRRDDPGTWTLHFADGTRFDRPLEPRGAQNDQLFVGFLEPGPIEVEIALTGAVPRSQRRAVTLLANRHQGLSFDLRTGPRAPSSLALTLGPDWFATEAKRSAELFALDRLCEQRRTAGTDGPGLPLTLEPRAEGGDGRLWAEARADGLEAGEYVLRLQPGGHECALYLEPGANAIEVPAPRPTARLRVALLDQHTEAPPAEAIVHWVAPLDPHREPLLVAPERAEYVGGAVEFEAPVGTVHLLFNATGLGTHFAAVELEPGGSEVTLRRSRRR